MAVTISLYSVIFLICVSQVLSEEYGATCAVAPNVGTPVAEQEPVVGVVTLSQNVTGESGGPTTIVISLTGFNKTDANLEHGFHIHESGDITGGCGGAGGHYNPNGVDHGAQTGTTSTRHVGDLGNIEEDTEGAVSITIIDNIVQLWGEQSVIGRAIVVHEKRDDLGLGGDDGSITTGNAGSRLACCKIMSTTGTGNTATSNKAVLSSALGMALIFLLKH